MYVKKVAHSVYKSMCLNLFRLKTEYYGKK